MSWKPPSWQTFVIENVSSQESQWNPQYSSLNSKESNFPFNCSSQWQESTRINTETCWPSPSFISLLSWTTVCCTIKLINLTSQPLPQVAPTDFITSDGRIKSLTGIDWRRLISKASTPSCKKFGIRIKKYLWRKLKLSEACLYWTTLIRLPKMS